jgi:ATP-binding cassette subfamily B protein
MNRRYTLKNNLTIPLTVSPILTVLIIIEMIISALMPSFQVFATATFIDYALKIFRGEFAYSRIYAPLLLMGLVVLYQSVSKILIDFAKTQLNMNLEKNIRPQVIEKRSRLEYQHVENNDSWELVNRVCANICPNITSGFDQILRLSSMIFRIVSILFILFASVWWAGLLVIILSAPLFIISFKGGKSNYTASKEAATYERRANYLADVLSKRDNVEERTVFGYTGYINRVWYEKYETARKINLKVKAENFVRMKAASLITILISLIISLVLIFSLYNEYITLGLFAGLVTATFNLVQYMSWDVSAIINDLANTREYIKDLNQFIQLSECKIMNGERLNKDPVFEQIEFRHVSFKYPGTKIYILRDISFVLESGKHYAFVGANGAGKSTIMKLLAGLYDNYEGEILINDISVNNYNDALLSKFISIVFQDFAKYYISIKDNIYFGDYSNFSEEALNKIFEKINLRNTIENMPDGLDTYLGKIKQGSVDFSGGQWQKLAIARALTRNSAVKVLDEPTAALDPVAESALYDLFDKICRDLTTVVITHRLGAAKLADEILVIDKGSLVEKGSHTELMERGGVYADMFESQRSWYQ